jgi:hypothetical protein
MSHTLVASLEVKNYANCLSNNYFFGLLSQLFATLGLVCLLTFNLVFTS